MSKMKMPRAEGTGESARVLGNSASRADEGKPDLQDEKLFCQKLYSKSRERPVIVAVRLQ